MVKSKNKMIASELTVAMARLPIHCGKNPVTQQLYSKHDRCNYASAISKCYIPVYKYNIQSLAERLMKNSLPLVGVAICKHVWLETGTFPLTVGLGMYAHAREFLIP